MLPHEELQLAAETDVRRAAERGGRYPSWDRYSPWASSRPTQVLKDVRLALGHRGPDNGSIERMRTYEQTA